MTLIHPAVDLSTGELFISSEIALYDTLSNAPSMSSKVPKTYPFLANGYSPLDGVCYFV